MANHAQTTEYYTGAIVKTLIEDTSCIRWVARDNDGKISWASCLIPLEDHDASSGTPSYKSIRVAMRAAA